MNLSLSLTCGGKLIAVEGPNLPSDTQFIPPGQKLEFGIEYEGRLPSTSVDDIVATATLVEEETSARFVSSDSLTSVQLVIEPIVGRAGARNRHQMGVREEFMLNVNPDIAKQIYYSPPWRRLQNTNFQCPISALSGGMRVEVLEMSYSPELDVVDPHGVLCTSGFNVSRDGAIAMKLETYVTPEDVCFSGIKLMEVPTEEIGPSGYFTNSVFTSIWYHTAQLHAGEWHRPGNDNFFFWDEPTFAQYCPPPITSGTIDWLIPIAWGEIDAVSGDDICGTADISYHQIFTLSNQGDLRIDKFGQWISCSTNGVITHSSGIR